MRMIRLGLALALLVTCIGCGGDDTAPVISGNGKPTKHTDAGDDPSDGRGRDGGGDASMIDGSDGGVMSGDAGGPDASAPDPRAPDVTFVAPLEVDDPNNDTLITTSTFKVKCKVTRSEHPDSRPVDQSTIRIDATYLGGDPLRPDKPTTLTSAVKEGDENTFEAEFNLSQVPNGPIEFGCSANDTSAPAIRGANVVHTFLDLGPTIDIVEPKDMSAHALKKDVLVKFRVSKAPVDLADKEASPTAVKLVVSGQAFPIEEDKKDRGLYTASIPFHDAVLFPMTPVTAEIVITASNKRTPDAPTRRAVSTIALDSSGPKITVTSPAKEAMVGAEFVISIKVSDPSGVDISTLVGSLAVNGGDVYQLENWKGGGDSWSTRIDTRSFGKSATELTIVLDVEDKVGNAAETSHILRRDTVPPLVSLDPPKIRESRVVGGANRCSTAFDPVGDLATNDLETKPESSVYRVLVLERTNTSEGEVYPHYAFVNNSSVTLYAQRIPGTPFLIDTNDDGKCDDVQVELADNKGNDISPIPLPLRGLDRRGVQTYKADDDFSDVAPDLCVGNYALPGAFLCEATEMERVIGQWLEGPKQPAIFVTGQQLNGTTGACTGESWEALANVGEGWRCFTARAEDKVGNVGIARPLRVCFDDGNAANGTPNCDDKDMAPTCLDDCELPDDIDLPPGTVIKER